LALGRGPCSLKTGAYCKARAKISETVLRRLTLEIGHELDRATPPDWRWHGRQVKLVDGTTLSMPDTPANQAEYPQPRTQKPGLGFPIIRAVVLLTLATAALSGAAFGPYKGKEAGETALFRTLLDQLVAGDVLLADRYYCSYFMLALVLDRKVDFVMRLHQLRGYDFDRGRRLGDADHVVVWHKPQRPKWMDKETYAAIPETLTVRELRVQVTKPGFRTKELVIVTSLVNADTFSKEAIGDLYHERWHIELDIRALKVTLKMDVLRCLTPAMIRREIWAHLLSYNLVRKVMAQAALSHGVTPRQISLTAAQQTLCAAWSEMTTATPETCAGNGEKLLSEVAKERVGDRPDRCEPRAVKRRPKPTRFLNKPRAEARAELLKG